MATVQTTYKGDMLFETKAGNHSLTVDLPATVGGKDRAMTPTEMCAASLCTCIGAVIGVYCKNVGIDATGLAVEMAYEKLDNPSRLGNFQAKVHLPGDIPEKRRAAILRVARQCPVHMTMKMSADMEVSWKE